MTNGYNPSANDGDNHYYNIGTPTMPITADRMITVLSIAQTTVKSADQMKQILRQIHGDTISLRTRLNEVKFKDEYAEDLVHSIMSLASSDTVKQFDIPLETLQSLGYEMARFEINKSKNKSAMLKRRARRALEKENEILSQRMAIEEIEAALGKEPENKDIHVEPRVLDHLLTEEEKDQVYMKMRGEEIHPELGPCDGIGGNEADGRPGEYSECSKCRGKWKQKQGDIDYGQPEEWLPRIGGSST